LISVSLLVFILVWKRSSVSSLPLVMLFPWAAILQGMDIMMVNGDFRNIVQITGLPKILFIVPGALLVGSGIFFLVSLFPRLGLEPEDRKSLFVVPAGIFLWSVSGVMVAHLFAPGSSIDVSYGLGEEIILSAYSYLILGAIVGTLLAVIYATLYRRIYQKLPGGLRMGTRRLTWKDLRIPGIVSLICVIVGLMIVLA